MGKPLTREFLLARNKCCGNKCLNCPYMPKHKKGSTEPQEEVFLTLAELLDQFDDGKIDISGHSARKYYLTEKDKALNKVSWIHDDEIKNQSVLRKLSKGNSRDLLRNMGLQ